MNYIKLLNAAFEKFFFDDRLNPTHISLYMALFQEWNGSRFANEFYINRQDLMRVAKIGSKSTYHRCVTDLDAWDYLSYLPSNNPYKGSKIKMSIIGTSDEPVTGQYNPILEQLAEQYHPIREPVVCQHRPINGQALVSTINNTKQANNNKQPKGRQAVLIFFKEKGFDADEGKKFYDHYEANKWYTSDGELIRDWQALAIAWMNRTQRFEQKNNTNKKEASHKQDNLRTTKNKDYGQPL
jgi:hypothetical protein